MDTEHIAVSKQSFGLIEADSKKSGKPMCQIAGEIISRHYSATDANSALPGGTLTDNVNTATPSENGGGGERWRKGKKGVREGRTRPIGWKSPKDYWNDLENDFLRYWVAYPSQGRLEFETSKKIFQKIRNAKDFPPPEIFLGVVRYLQENIWPSIVPSNPDYVPKLSKILKEAEWRHIGHQNMVEILRKREFYKGELARRLNEFKGNNMQSGGYQEQEVIHKNN